MVQFDIKVFSRNQIRYVLDQENRGLVREENKRREYTHLWLYRKLTGGEIIYDGFMVSILLFIALCLTVPDYYGIYRIIIPWVVWSLIIISYFAFRGKYGGVYSMNHLRTTTYFRSISDLSKYWDIFCLDRDLKDFLRSIEQPDGMTPIAVECLGELNFLVVFDPENGNYQYYLAEISKKPQ